LRSAPNYPTPRFKDPNDTRLVEIISPSKGPESKAVNILGIPFDGGVLGRKGASGGPEAVRQSLSGFSNYNVELDLSLESAKIFDLGDLVVSRSDVLGAHREIEDEVGHDLEPTSLLTIVGGDNSVSLPAIRAFGRKFGRIGLIVVDSHFDLRGKISGNPTSGSSFGLAISTVGGLDPHKVVEVGIHGFLNSQKYARIAERLGIRVFTADEVRKVGTVSIAKRALDIAARGTSAVYLSVDIDAVDNSFVSGVSAPSVGGISSMELCELVFELASSDMLKCADLVEVAPSLDPTGKTQVVAATALVYLIAGFQDRKRRKV